MSKFCQAPWMNISTDVNGSIRPCCRYEQPHKQTEYKMPWMKDAPLNELWNGNELRSLRQAFLDGNMPKECNWCWSEEDAGIFSFRQSYNRHIVDTSSTYSPYPLVYDFKLSNVCNLKCRMCGPMASSSILKEDKRHGMKFEDEKYWLSEKILNTYNEELFFKDWLPNVKELEFTGGEPFFSQENKKMIRRISKTPYAKNIQILITTNATLYDTKTLDSLKEFKHTIISLSIDDIGKRLEYQRSGSNWNEVSKNILRLHKEYPSFQISIYRTINNYNVWYLNELNKWAFSNNINVADGYLHDPEWLSIRHLPGYVKRDLNLQYGDSNSMQDLLSFINLPSKYKTIKQFKLNSTKYDLMRSEIFSEVFNEWAEVLMYDG